MKSDVMGTLSGGRAVGVNIGSKTSPVMGSLQKWKIRPSFSFAQTLSRIMPRNGNT